MKGLYCCFVLLVLFFSSGCADHRMTKGEQGAVFGTATGALVGQIIGRDTKGTLIGASLGSFLGYMLGNEIDKYDRQRMNQVYEISPSGQTTSWVNPDNGSQYSMTPQPASSDIFRSKNGRLIQTVCRDAEIESVINGKREVVRTTACREFDEAGNPIWVLQP